MTTSPDKSYANRHSFIICYISKLKLGNPPSLTKSTNWNTPSLPEPITFQNMFPRLQGHCHQLFLHFSFTLSLSSHSPATLPISPLYLLLRSSYILVFLISDRVPVLVCRKFQILSIFIRHQRHAVRTVTLFSTVLRSFSSGILQKYEISHIYHSLVKQTHLQLAPNNLSQRRHPFLREHFLHPSEQLLCTLPSTFTTKLTLLTCLHLRWQESQKSQPVLNQPTLIHHRAVQEQNMYQVRYKCSACHRYHNLIRKHLDKPHKRFTLPLLRSIQNTSGLAVCITSSCTTDYTTCSSIRLIACAFHYTYIPPIYSGRNNTFLGPEVSCTCSRSTSQTFPM